MVPLRCSASETKLSGPVTRPRRVGAVDGNLLRPDTKPALQLQPPGSRLVRASLSGLTPRIRVWPQHPRLSPLLKSSRLQSGPRPPSPDPLERVGSTTAPILADDPAEADLIESVSSSNLAVPFTEFVTVANPQEDLQPLNGIEQNGSSDAEVHGIAPSAFGSGVREASLEGTNREQEEADLSVAPCHALEDRDGTSVEQVGLIDGVIPEVAIGGLPPASTGSDVGRKTRGYIRNVCDWVRHKPYPDARIIPGSTTRSLVSRRLRGGHSCSTHWRSGLRDTMVESSLSKPGSAELWPFSPAPPPLSTPLAAGTLLTDEAAQSYGANSFAHGSARPRRQARALAHNDNLHLVVSHYLRGICLAGRTVRPGCNCRPRQSDHDLLEPWYTLTARDPLRIVTSPLCRFISRSALLRPIGQLSIAPADLSR